MRIKPTTLIEQQEALNHHQAAAYAYYKWIEALAAQVEFATEEFGENAEPLTDTEEAVSVRRSHQQVQMAFANSTMALRASRT